MDMEIFSEEKFPHGLLCESCGRPIGVGEKYSERLHGMVGEHFVVIYVCGSCTYNGSMYERNLAVD